MLNPALRAGAAAVAAGEHDPAAVCELVADIVEAEPLATLDYAEVRDPVTLAPVGVIDGDVRLLAASRFGATRLLDNVAAAPS